MPVRVRYENGVLKPIDKLDLEEGEEVEIIVVRRSRGLGEAVRRISREYRDVREDPLRRLLEGRR